MTAIIQRIEISFPGNGIGKNGKTLMHRHGVEK